MTTPVLPLVIHKGQDFNIQTALTEDDGVTAIDITGYTIEADLRAELGGAVLAEFSYSAVDEPNGVFSLNLTDEQTAVITYQRGTYDVKMTDTSGYVTYILRGTIEFIERVTE